MRIKKGDKVQIMAGKDRGKSGAVLKIDTIGGRILIEGINLYTKHSRPKREGEKGETVIVPRSVSSANVMPYCASCGRGVRIGMRTEGDKKVRYCRRCKTSF